MKKSPDDIHQLFAQAEASMKNTAQLKQVLAQIEATLSRKENDKVAKKSQRA